MRCFTGLNCMGHILLWCQWKFLCRNIHTKTEVTFVVWNCKLIIQFFKLFFISEFQPLYTCCNVTHHDLFEHPFVRLWRLCDDKLSLSTTTRVYFVCYRTSREKLILKICNLLKDFVKFEKQNACQLLYTILSTHENVYWLRYNSKSQIKLLLLLLKSFLYS
jgi:hypothetical protein